MLVVHLAPASAPLSGSRYHVCNRIRRRSFSTELLPPDHQEPNHEQQGGLKKIRQKQWGANKQTNKQTKTEPRNPLTLTATRPCPHHSGLETHNKDKLGKIHTMKLHVRSSTGGSVALRTLDEAMAHEALPFAAEGASSAVVCAMQTGMSNLTL